MLQAGSSGEEQGQGRVCSAWLGSDQSAGMSQVLLLYMCPHTIRTAALYVSAYHSSNAWPGRDEYAGDDGGGWRLGERMVHKVR
jgi:hypothetical protein